MKQRRNAILMLRKPGLVHPYMQKTGARTYHIAPRAHVETDGTLVGVRWANFGADALLQGSVVKTSGLDAVLTNP